MSRRSLPAWMTAAMLGAGMLGLHGCELPRKDDPQTCSADGECGVSGYCNLMTYQCMQRDASVEGGGDSGGSNPGGGGVGGAGGLGGIGMVASGGRAAGGSGAAGSGGAASGGRGGMPGTGGAAPPPCTSAASCAVTPAKPICDLAGSHLCVPCSTDVCSRNFPLKPVCGAVPLSPPPVSVSEFPGCVECNADTQCAAKTGTPVCAQGTCVACNQSTDCTAATSPICNGTTHVCAKCATKGECMSRTPNVPVVCLASGACSECAVDGDCASLSGRTACSTSNVCVQCTKDANCSGATPVCDTASNKCVKCPSDDACVKKNGTALQWCSMTAGSTTLGMCVQCRGNADCANPTPGCSALNTCVACTLDAHCAATTPICDTALNKCSLCSSDGACFKRNGAALPICLAAPGNGTCVQCRANTDCSGATPGCFANKCVPCTLDAHCGGATPICDTTTNQCTRCTSDAQCKAKVTLGGNPGVCMTHVDGHCAIDSETLYVENRAGCTDAVGGGTSTKPFCSMQGAVTGLTTGKLIVVRGPVGSAASGLSVATVSIIGQSSAVIAAALSPALRITSGNAYLRDLTLGSVSDVGCVAVAGSTLRMDHVAATRSTGGILIDGAAFDIRNSTIQFNNPNATSDSVWSGIRIQGPVPAAGPRVLTQVTISNNQGPGLSCVSAIQGTGVLAASNLLSDVSPSCAITACMPAGPTCGGGLPP